MSEPPTTLIALVCHGSRDRRASEGFKTFVRECQETLVDWHVVGCQLELVEVSLARQLQQAIQNTDPFHISDVVVVPILMAAGVHVQEDIPSAIADATQLSPQVAFHLTPPIGQAQQFTDVLTSAISAAPTCESWVLWGHGSRRASFAKQFEQIGQALSANTKHAGKQTVLAAYAKQSPNLECQVQRLYESGNRNIGILTGLLFPGWLSDRLSDNARALEAELPHVHLYVSPVLMPHPFWIDAVRELVVETFARSTILKHQAA